MKDTMTNLEIITLLEVLLKIATSADITGGIHTGGRISQETGEFAEKQMIRLLEMV